MVMNTKIETLSDMLPPEDELEADLARLAELQELRAEVERLDNNIAVLEAENERLRARIIMLLRCHYDEHEHHGSPTCFDIQSPTDEWETAALFHVRWTA